MMNWREALATTEEAPRPTNQPWHLCLYVASTSPKAAQAEANLRLYCETHLAGRYELEIIDLVKYPERAQHDQVIALPLLVRRSPSPCQYLVGTLAGSAQLAQHLAVGIPYSL